MELKNLLFVRLLFHLQNLVLNCLSWEILGKTLFDDLISKTLVDYVGVLRNLGLMLIDSNIIWVNLVILLDRGLIHLCRAQYWLQIQFHRLRVHALHLSTIQFLMVSLTGSHRSLRWHNTTKWLLVFHRLIETYLKPVFVERMTKRVWVIKWIWNWGDGLTRPLCVQYSVINFKRVLIIEQPLVIRVLWVVQIYGVLHLQL